MGVPDGVKHVCMISGHWSLAWSTRNGSFALQAWRSRHRRRSLLLSSPAGALPELVAAAVGNRPAWDVLVE
jgi:hypothetical protein